MLTGIFLKYSFPWVHFWCSCAWLTREQFILLKQMFQTLPMDFPLSGFKGLFSCGLMLHYIIIHVLKVLVKLHFLWNVLHHYMKGKYYLNTVWTGYFTLTYSICFQDDTWLPLTLNACIASCIPVWRVWHHSKPRNAVWNLKMTRVNLRKDIPHSRSLMMDLPKNPQGWDFNGCSVSSPLVQSVRTFISHYGEQKQLSELYLALLLPWLHIAHLPPLLLQILENINILSVRDVRQGTVQADCVMENEVPLSPWWVR